MEAEKLSRFEGGNQVAIDTKREVGGLGRLPNQHMVVWGGSPINTKRRSSEVV